MSEATEDFVRRTVAEYPELEPMLTEHLNENFGELLPHLWISDLARYVIDRYQAAGTSAVSSILHHLDAEAGRHPEIDELLAVSFLELMPYPNEPTADVTELLGPNLREMLQEQRT